MKQGMQNGDNNAKRVGIWVRVSTEDQVRGESPETHERRARLYAEAKGWNVVELYRLDAVSGKTVKDTPEAKQHARRHQRWSHHWTHFLKACPTCQEHQGTLRFLRKIQGIWC